MCFFPLKEDAKNPETNSLEFCQKAPHEVLYLFFFPIQAIEREVKYHVSLDCALLECLSGCEGTLLLAEFSRLDWRIVVVFAILSKLPGEDFRTE